MISFRGGVEKVFQSGISIHAGVEIDNDINCPVVFHG
jgi:hypothetical protein